MSTETQQTMTIATHVNGAPLRRSVVAPVALADVLRDELDLTAATRLRHGRRRDHGNGLLGSGAEIHDGTVCTVVSGNVVGCTGYETIADAVLAVATTAEGTDG